jgi:hypothetical protein
LVTGNGKRKRSLSEDDVYLLLHRFAPLPIGTHSDSSLA